MEYEKMTRFLKKNVGAQNWKKWAKIPKWSFFDFLDKKPWEFADVAYGKTKRRYLAGATDQITSKKKNKTRFGPLQGGGLWINSSSEFSSKFDSTKKIDSPKFLARPLDDFHRGFRWDPYGFPCD